MKKVITFGTFDLFHLGHLRILERARALGDYLVVGVSTDQLSFSKKNYLPVFSECNRMNIVRAIRYVDEVFREESLEKKREYIRQHRADVLVMGEDWKGKFDVYSDLCEVVYLERTVGVSTTDLKRFIKSVPGEKEL
ncbi:MAG: glycerol-3-phosphate cytidylyltransferase [Chthoniobacterales bacterium]|nr:MAG: glycerol-3-phosphate cytidylyltransferase [Chthoniobacterales bacterium]